MDMDVDGDGDDNGMDEDEDEEMPVFFKELKDGEAAAKDTKTPSRNPKSKVALVVRAKVEKVLSSTGLAEKRARQCDQNDFLKLLLGIFPRSSLSLRLVLLPFPPNFFPFGFIWMKVADTNILPSCSLPRRRYSFLIERIFSHDEK